MKTIIAVNAKGGSGKSTFTFYLSQALARQGFKVLVCDTDSHQRACLDILQQPEHLHPNIRVQAKLAAPVDFQPDVRLIDTEGRSDLCDHVLRPLNLTKPCLFVVPTSASTPDVRQIAVTQAAIQASNLKAPVFLLWGRVDTRTTAARPEVLANYANLLRINAFKTIVPPRVSFASMQLSFDKLTEKDQAVWNTLTLEIISAAGLIVPTVPESVAVESGKAALAPV